MIFNDQLKGMVVTVVFGLLLNCSVFAQKQNIYLLTNNGKEVSVKDSADYIRIVSEPDSGSKFFNVKEFYKNGVPKFVGHSSDINGVNLQGDYIQFFPSGKRREIGRCTNSVRVGDIYSYYPNGRLYSIMTYNRSKHLMVGCNDSTGRELATNKEGHFLIYDDGYKTIVEEGEIRAGVKHGEWKGSFGTDKWHGVYSELYKNGQLISGKSVQNGATYAYKYREVNAKYKDGRESFNRFIAKHIRNSNQYINGIVYIEFIVDKDGSITDASVARAPGNRAMADEALRVIRSSPKWNPSTLFGVPVPRQFTIPINFIVRSK